MLIQRSWAFIHTEPHRLMFVPSLFIIAKTEKQTQFILGRWMYKLWYIQRMKYYAVLHRNGLLSHEKDMDKL